MILKITVTSYLLCAFNVYFSFFSESLTMHAQYSFYLSSIISTISFSWLNMYTTYTLSECICWVKEQKTISYYG